MRGEAACAARGAGDVDVVLGWGVGDVGGEVGAEGGEAGGEQGEVVFEDGPKPVEVADPGDVVSVVEDAVEVDGAEDPCCDDAAEV